MFAFIGNCNLVELQVPGLDYDFVVPNPLGGIWYSLRNQPCFV